MRFRHAVNTLNDWATGDSGLPEEEEKQNEEEQQEEKMVKLEPLSHLVLEVHTARFDCTCAILPAARMPCSQM